MQRRLWINLILLVLIVLAATAYYFLREPAKPAIQSASSPPEWLENTAPPATEKPKESPTGSVAGTPTESAAATVEPSLAPATPEPEDIREATWMAVGDILLHSPLLPGAYISESDSYDFTPYLDPIKHILLKGDWVIANLETPIADKSFGYSGYPKFNAPAEIASALKQVGFNLITNANNHSLDRGEAGVLSTLQNLKSIGIPSVGTAASEEEAEELLLMERNGIVMGLLAYTYGTNGIPIPKDKPYLVNLIDEEKITKDIQRLREAGADLVTVAMHYGTEYQTKPNEEQIRISRSLVAAGADIIAGSHAHVLQPYEVVEVPKEDGSMRTGVIIYSMGNFISNQRGETKDYGAIYQVNVKKNMNSGQVSIEDVVATPTWVYRYKKAGGYQYRVLPVEETLDAQADKLLTPAEYASLQSTYDQLQKRLSSMLNSQEDTPAAP